MGTEEATGGFPGFSVFLESRANRFRYKPATEEFYRKELGYVLRRAGELEITAPEHFTPQTIEALEGLLAKTAGRMSVHKYLRVLKTFLRWCESRGYIEKAPHITLPKVDPLIEPVREEDFAKLIRAAKKTTYPRRAVALLLVMGRAGLRAGEVCRLKVDDFKVGQLRLLNTKTGRDRIIPLPDSVAAALDQYLRRERPQTFEKWLFLAQDGGQMMPEDLRLFCKRLSKSAGVHVHPHLLRHTFAFHGVMRGVPVNVIQYMLGHTNLTTTLRYIHLSGGDAAKWRSAWD